MNKVRIITLKGKVFYTEIPDLDEMINLDARIVVFKHEDLGYVIPLERIEEIQIYEFGEETE